MTVKAVVFDIGGVLERVDDAAWPQLWLRRWERRMGKPPGSVLSALARHEPTGAAENGELSEAALRDRYARALGLDDDRADEMMAQMWDAYCGRLDVVMRDFVACLRPRFTTAILSNSMDGARREEQRRHGFGDLVDVVVYSHEEGVAKPDPAIFRLVEERLGMEPPELVLVDDSAINVEAARACGWRAVRHADADSSIRALTRLLE
jgi:epoxide hydrolase-like predicted phosphatase